jgi:hypothetical protein
VLIAKQSRFSYPVEKPINSQLGRYQGVAVGHDSINVDAFYLEHLRLSLNRDIFGLMRFHPWNFRKISTFCLSSVKTANSNPWLF